MNFQYRLITLLLIIFSLTNFLSCGDTPESIILEQVLQETLTHESPYTGKLIRVGNTEKFGLNLDDPVAIEWNGEQLYMLANQGRYTNKRQYLFTVDRFTGNASMVSGIMNLGGSFDQGRGFTQVLYVSPNDMAWHPEGYMLAVCPVIDSIVGIDIEKGTASRVTFQKDFCLRTDDGYRVIGAGRALAHDGKDLWMWGITGRSVEQNNLGNKSFAQLYKFSHPEIAKCVIPVGNPIIYGRTEAEHDADFQSFLDGKSAHPSLPDEGEAHASTFCFDGQHLYASGIDTRGLYIVNRSTGELHFVAKWEFAITPPGYEKHELGGYLNIEENILAQWAPSITGLAFDGENMYAVEGFTDALYKVEKR